MNTKTLNTVIHITTAKNYKKIQKTGLKPKIGKLSKKLGEAKKAIFTFIDMDQADNALMNWMGEEYEELAEDMGVDEIELVVLEVDVSHLNIPIQLDENGDVFFEQVIMTPIAPEKIKFIRSE